MTLCFPMKHDKHIQIEYYQGNTYLWKSYRKRFFFLFLTLDCSLTKNINKYDDTLSIPITYLFINYLISVIAMEFN